MPTWEISEEILVETFPFFIDRDRLVFMLNNSVPIKSPHGNRRWANYLFRVEGAKVVMFGFVHPWAAGRFPDRSPRP